MGRAGRPVLPRSPKIPTAAWRGAWRPPPAGGACWEGPLPRHWLRRQRLDPRCAHAPPPRSHHAHVLSPTPVTHHFVRFLIRCASDQFETLINLRLEGFCSHNVCPEPLSQPQESEAPAGVDMNPVQGTHLIACSDAGRYLGQTCPGSYRLWTDE